MEQVFNSGFYCLLICIHNILGYCLLGGIIWGLAKGHDIHLSIKIGMFCAKLSVESHENVSPYLSEDRMKKELKLSH